ncbi:hypothetical protein E0Z10_g8241 [Xylaria hypoxylon]|uniref:Uncharacterized protein n=1 Tax=Xylaria hypoxylon TaxID=37992 RepID=A0A4Z0YM66_9PEZI|nr:hypothetical protein E0Z10_g8241 [Xylaria hypoxylon]
MTTLYPAVTSNGVVTSFVPLTTLFTPSAECSGYFRLDGLSLVAFDPGYGLDIDTDVRCLPSAVTTWWEQGRLGDNGEDHTAISLGPLVCPYKWQTVATSVENELTTLAMCCPSLEYQEGNTKRNRDNVELIYNTSKSYIYAQLYFRVFLVPKCLTVVKQLVSDEYRPQRIFMRKSRSSMNCTTGELDDMSSWGFLRVL